MAEKGKRERLQEKKQVATWAWGWRQWKWESECSCDGLARGAIVHFFLCVFDGVGECVCVSQGYVRKHLCVRERRVRALPCARPCVSVFVFLCVLFAWRSSGREQCAHSPRCSKTQRGSVTCFGWRAFSQSVSQTNRIE